MRFRVVHFAVLGLIASALSACGSDSAASVGSDPIATTALTAAATDPSEDGPVTTIAATTPPLTRPPLTAAPAPAASTSATITPAAPAAPVVPRVLLVGDSTLLAVGEYGALDALLGMDPVYEAASCRALAQPSCGDDPPTNSVEVIDSAEGVFDAVVVMAGYDEWYTTFADSFDKVVTSSRAKGAKWIIWLTYPEGVDYLLPNKTPANGSLVNMNRIMRDKVSSGSFADVVIADWFNYSSATQGWYSNDDIHLSRTGAFGVADYIARKVAFLAGQSCPMPREPGAPVEAPCPDPDLSGPVSDVVSLYTT